MKRVSKKYIGKLCYVIWGNIYSKHRTCVKDILKEGYENYETVGWPLYISKDIFVIATERCLKDATLKDLFEREADLTFLHPVLVKSIKTLNNP